MIELLATLVVIWQSMLMVIHYINSTYTCQGFGRWKSQNIDSVIENPKMDEFVTSSMVIMKTIGGETYTEKHVFVAAYTNTSIFMFNLPLSVNTHARSLELK
ncbi:hypothetical protein D3C76_823530 [compost metagenome]